MRMEIASSPSRCATFVTRPTTTPFSTTASPARSAPASCTTTVARTSPRCKMKRPPIQIATRTRTMTSSFFTAPFSPFFVLKRVLHQGHRVPEKSAGRKTSMSSVDERVKAIIVEQLGVDAEEVTQEASFVEDLGADSLDTVELIMAFEEEFGVEISDDEAEKIRKVKDAVEYIDKRQSAS